jgi:cytochrome c peroxidase
VYKRCLLYFCWITLGYACKKTDVRSPEPTPYALLVPANFPQPISDPNNPLTQEGIALGRVLFYDKKLSGNNNISCASCHLPEKAFSDGVALSNIGVSGISLHRHAPALINMAWMNKGLFWDGGSSNLESQAFAPLASPDEMAQNLLELVEELKADPVYPQLFRKAFQREISSALIAKALAQFQRTFISANSRYDRFKRKQPGISLSFIEAEGLQLVQQHCQGCHTGELFTDNDYRNNGLDADFSNDQFEGIFQGRFRISYSPADLGKFKTPTLRNILLTAPYMHDGRFSNIEQVLDHYSDGVKKSASTDPLVMKKNNNTPGIPLSSNDKQKIIAFLATLTDSSFITHPQLVKPN